MTKQISSETPSTKAFQEVIEAVRLESVECTRYLAERRVSKEKIFSVAPLDFGISTNTRFDLAAEGKRLLVFADFVLDAPSKKEGSEPFVHVELTFLLEYKVNTERSLDQEALKAFADLNSTFNAWPYFREAVQSATARMALPPLVLPLFRLPR